MDWRLLVFCLQLWDMTPVVSWDLWITSSQQKSLFDKLSRCQYHWEEKRGESSSRIDVIWIIFSSFLTCSGGCWTFTARALQASEAWEPYRLCLTQGYRELLVDCGSLCVCVSVQCAKGWGISLCKLSTHLMYLISMHSFPVSNWKFMKQSYETCLHCGNLSNPDFTFCRCEAPC